MRRSLILILFVLCRTFLYCQADSVKQEPYVYFNAVSLITGFTANEFQSHTPGDLKALAPNNSIVNTGLTDAQKIGYAGNGSGNVKFNFGANIHLKTKDLKKGKARFSSEWRIGINIGTTLNEWMNYRVETTVPEDTFYSNHTDVKIYEGGDTQQRYQYILKSKQAYLDLTKTYHSNQLKRVSLFAGINVGIGYNYNNELKATTASNYEGRTRRNKFLESYPGAVSETTELPDAVFYNVTVPVGVQLRMVSTKYKMAKKIAFTFESRFGYRFDNYYGNNYKPVFIGGLQIGCKLFFHKQKTD